MRGTDELIKLMATGGPADWTGVDAATNHNNNSDAWLITLSDGLNSIPVTPDWFFINMFFALRLSIL